MTVDSTDLLNRRDLVSGSKDKQYLQSYPTHEAQPFTFDTVVVYYDNNLLEVADEKTLPSEPMERLDCIVVSYGNGVATARELQQTLKELNFAVVDCPYLSDTPKGLSLFLEQHSTIPVVFADVCKEGANPMSAMIIDLNKQSLLPRQWTSVAAAKTYNPLGSLVTFLSAEDIQNAMYKLIQK